MNKVHTCKPFLKISSLFIITFLLDTNFKSMGPNLTILEQWSDRFYEIIKLDRNTNSELASYLKNAGYTNVREKSIELPIDEWPDSEGKKQKKLYQIMNSSPI